MLQEVTPLVVSLLYLLITIATYYCYRLSGQVHLRTGALAGTFLLVGELINMAVIVTGVEALVFGVVLSRFLFSVCFFSALRQFAGQGSSILFIIPAFSAFVAIAVAAPLLQLESGAWMLEIPALSLIVLGIVLLVAAKRSPGIWIASTVVCVYVLTWVTGGPELMALTHFVNLALCAVLILLAFENLVDDHQARESELQRVEFDKHRLATQMEQSRKLESLGALASGIAHDFNNMLTSVLGFSSAALKKLPGNSSVRNDLFMVMSGAREASELTSQMLTYAGKGELDFAAVDISRLVDSMGAINNSIVPGSIKLEKKFAPNLPMVRGDAVLLGQVLMNLVSNAVDAIPGGSGRIEIRTGLSRLGKQDLARCFFAEDQSEGAFVYLQVSDSGVGITEEQRWRIFDPFYSDKSVHRGLGLSAMSGIVRQHKGFIDLSSTPGEGSTFTVYLPLVTFEDQARLKGNLEQPINASEANVLVADDDPRIRSLVAFILNDEGFNAHELDDGREVQEYLDETDREFNLFVLDCSMPGLTGPEIYRMIRRSSLTAPIVLMSGYQQEQVIRDISHDSWATFIQKPFSVDELLEVVESVRSGVAVSTHG